MDAMKEIRFVSKKKNRFEWTFNPGIVQLQYTLPASAKCVYICFSWLREERITVAKLGGQ